MEHVLVSANSQETIVINWLAKTIVIIMATVSKGNAIAMKDSVDIYVKRE